MEIITGCLVTIVTAAPFVAGLLQHQEPEVVEVKPERKLVKAYYRKERYDAR